ncbi:MAG: cupin domain-containing protein [Oscillospiraceae bacterium]|nr:cupin domain-containing protein [Oscillospiraceae bacterium]
MVKRKTDHQVQLVEKLRGGEGAATVERLLMPAELCEKSPLFAKITLQPGSSIGYHIHEGEMEAFYILSGEAEFLDKQETVTLSPGDSTLTQSGEGHSIKSVGNTPLELIALILYK